MIVVSDPGFSCVSSKDLTDQEGVASSSSISENFNGAEEDLRDHWDGVAGDLIHIRDGLSKRRLMSA